MTTAASTSRASAPDVVLKAARLTLRAPEPRDVPDIAQFANDWDVARMLSRMPFPYAESDAAWWVGHAAESRRAGREAAFAIEIDSRFAGACGLHAAEDDETVIELGYWLGRPYWGRGYATEAASRLMAHAQETLRLDVLVAGWFEGNAASGRVLSKLGFLPTHDIARFSRARNSEVTCHMAIWRADAGDSDGLGRDGHGG